MTVDKLLTTKAGLIPHCSRYYFYLFLFYRENKAKCDM